MTRSASASMFAPATTSTNICARSGATRWSDAPCSTSRRTPASSSRSLPATRCCPRSARRSPSTIATARPIRTPAISSPLGTDFAGLGGNAHFVRTNVNGQYFIPLDRFTGNSDWGIALTGGHRLPVQRGAAGADHRPVLPGRRQPARLPDRRRRPARCGHRRSAGRAVHLDPVDRAALPAADLGRHRAVRPRLRRYRRPDPGQLREPRALPRGDRRALRDRRLPGAARRRRCRHLLAHSVRSVKR